MLLSFQANKINSFNVWASIIEVNLIRSKVYDWLDAKSYQKQNHILLVPAYGNNEECRPTLIRHILKYPDQSDVGKWSSDVNHYFEVLSAILRERSDHPVGRDMEIVNCAYDKSGLNKENMKPFITFSLLGKNENMDSYQDLKDTLMMIDISALTDFPLQKK
jgi:hypothetical protein